MGDQVYPMEIIFTSVVLHCHEINQCIISKIYYDTYKSYHLQLSHIACWPAFLLLPMSVYMERQSLTNRAEAFPNANTVKDILYIETYPVIPSNPVNTVLTHLKLDKMAAISQTTYSNAFSWMKMLEFRFNFNWIFFLRVQLTIDQHWFR